MSTTLIAYRTAPNSEHRAAEELRRAGFGGVLPTDTSGKRSKVTAPGYVFGAAAYQPAFRKHVRDPIGRVSLTDVMRLYIRPDPPAPPAAKHRYKANDPFKATKGPFAEKSGVVLEPQGKRYWVEIGTLKLTLHPDYMTPIVVEEQHFPQRPP